MFKDVVIGQRITLVHRASVSVIDSVVIDVSEHGVWVDLPGKLVLFADDMQEAGWELT